MLPRATRLESSYRATRGPYRVTPAAIRRAEEGAVLVARRGAGACLVTNCEQPRAVTPYHRGGRNDGQDAARPGPLYCEEHHDGSPRQAGAFYRRDRELMRDVLDHATAAFVPDELAVVAWFLKRRAAA